MQYEIKVSHSQYAILQREIVRNYALHNVIIQSRVYQKLRKNSMNSTFMNKIQ